MTVTGDSPFRSAPRISRDGFRNVLLTQAAAGVIAERDPRAYWDAIVGYGIDPLFLAAMFNHESQMGRAGTAITTHSWGNTRLPNFGPDFISMAIGRSGEFPVFRDWLDGCKSTAARLVEPTWVYAGRTAIREIFDHPSGDVWAPAGDLNDPAGYLRAVLDFMNKYADGGQPVAVDISGYVPPKIVQQWFPVNGVSYMGEDMDIWGICVHETGNTDAGSEAQANVNYMNTQECIQRQASWHATVGLDTIIETIPDTKQAYHASDGSGPGNVHFFAVEGVVCYPVGSDKFKRVMQNQAWYVAKKLRDNGLEPVFARQDAPYDGHATVCQHNTFARDHKDCPMQYRDNALWGAFCDLVQAFYGQMGGAMPAPQPGDDPVTHKFIHQDFRAYFDSHGGVDMFGRPVSGAFNEGDRLTQYFERAVMQAFPENKEPYKVQLRLLGAEELARKYPTGAPA